MTDQRLQALSRAARLDPSREPELLRERVRAGTLDPEKLELAAYCGHEAAMHACDEAGRTLGDVLMECFPKGSPRRVEADEWGGTAMAHLSPRPLGTMPLALWVRGLSRWGAEAQVRAAVAAGWVALERWAPCPGNPGGSWESDPRGLCGCGYGYDSHVNPDKNPALARAHRTLDAAEAVLGGIEGTDPYEHQRAWDEGWSSLWRTLPWIPAPWASPGARETEIASAARLAGGSAVRTAIQQALTAWALG